MTQKNNMAVIYYKDKYTIVIVDDYIMKLGYIEIAEPEVPNLVEFDSTIETKPLPINRNILYLSGRTYGGFPVFELKRSK